MELLIGAATGVWGPAVGKTASVGNGASVATSVVGIGGMAVGGTEVFVGIADCVMAIEVQASATAVFCTSAPLKPGADFGPQAASAKTTHKEIAGKNFLFIVSPLMGTFTTKARTG